jgi:bifunctional DNA-binding transcriptional regulator/antitoxin component of YhaV-PrlF toxin-antitoxin module
MTDGKVWRTSIESDGVLIVPDELVDAMGLKVGDPVTMTPMRDQIVVRFGADDYDAANDPDYRIDQEKVRSVKERGDAWRATGRIEALNLEHFASGDESEKRLVDDYTAAYGPSDDSDGLDENAESLDPDAGKEG